MVIQAYIFLNEKLEPHLSFEDKSVKYNLSSLKEASKPINDAPAPLSSRNRPIAQAQHFQAAQNMSQISEVNQTSQNIPTQDRKRPIADETEKDEVKILKPDPEDEPLSMLGQHQEDDSFFVESTDESPIADDVKIEAVDSSEIETVEVNESDTLDEKNTETIDTMDPGPSSVSTSTALNSSAEQLVKIEENPDECTDYSTSDSTSDRRITNVFPRDFRGTSNTPNVFYIENGREYRLRPAREFYPTIPGVVDIRMECRFKKGIKCPFATMLRSIKTFDPSDPRYFTPGNWRFLPDSENYYQGMNNFHKCAGRRVGINQKPPVRPTVRVVGKSYQFLACPDTIYPD